MNNLWIIVVTLQILYAAAYGVGSCNNDHDLTITANKIEMKKTTTMCGRKYQANVKKTAECVHNESGISDECSLCYGQDAACTMKACLLVCMIDSASFKCEECSYQHCGRQMQQCVGFTIDPPKAESPINISTK
uniref:Uncharacterized protein n=1 Tax=Spongospora subterranea TaxID=70186 RepID=A0A0H5RR36_9EUKA|eukprot:CRZ11184.1 hypothetical protein [Spongospora subterranea]